MNNLGSLEPVDVTNTAGRIAGTPGCVRSGWEAALAPRLRSRLGAAGIVYVRPTAPLAGPAGPSRLEICLDQGAFSARPAGRRHTSATRRPAAN